MLQYSLVTCTYRKIIDILQTLFRIELSSYIKIVYKFIRKVVNRLDGW